MRQVELLYKQYTQLCIERWLLNLDKIILNLLGPKMSSMIANQDKWQNENRNQITTSDSMMNVRIFFKFRVLYEFGGIVFDRVLRKRKWNHILSS